MAEPLVSVVLAFRSPPINLLHLLRRLSEQELSPDLFEVVLVDNAPKSARGRIARTVSEMRWPFTVRVEYEPKAGLSRARNRGIRSAQGRYVAITDAETVPEPGWLAALVTAATEEQAFCVGGRVDSRFPPDTPLVMTEELMRCHGPVDWPKTRSPLTWPYWLTGCNLLFDRERALALGLFREDLGRRGRLLLGCEDLEFVERARQHGLRVLIEPNAMAQHRVSRVETTVGWYLAQGAGHGISVARMSRSVTVSSQAARVDLDAVLTAIESLIAGWGFLHSSYAAEGARDLMRIAAYRLEQARLALLNLGARQ